MRSKALFEIEVKTIMKLRRLSRRDAQKYVRERLNKIDNPDKGNGRRRKVHTDYFADKETIDAADFFNLDDL